MLHENLDELKEWSARKHELVIKYLTGFVRILGGSIKGSVYYIDGFAGPGIYGDGAEGSPVLAAKYARTLVDKHYGLHCINIEVEPEHFKDLDQSTLPYQAFVDNYCGPFGDHVDIVLHKIGRQPAIFFLDPFGIKGLEWKYISPILSRTHTTEVILRINPKDISRLAGFAGSNSQGAISKRQVLTDLYGFSDSEQWEQVWFSDRTDGLIRLYQERLLGEMKKRKAYISTYAIRSIEGATKYYLMFLTRHPKGAVLMSNIICEREKCYERDVVEYQRECQSKRQAQQLSMLDALCPDPTEEEILENLADRLKEDIWEEFAGRTASRICIHETMLKKWFGRVKNRHFTRALEKLTEEGRITNNPQRFSGDNTTFTFRNLVQNRTFVL